MGRRRLAEAEAEGEVVGAFEAGAVEDGVVDGFSGYVLELVADLGEGHVLAGNEAVEDRAGDAGIFAVGARAFLAFCALGGIGGGLEPGLDGDEGVGGDGAVFHVPLHLEAFGDEGAEHVAEVFVVDEVAGGKLCRRGRWPRLWRECRIWRCRAIWGR